MPYKNIEDARTNMKRWRKANPEYHKDYNKYYRQIKPWAKTLQNINSRCTNKNHPYYKKRVKSFLTVKKLEYLWHRDKAFNLYQPSIDRIESDKHYTLENCRFIEFEDHKKEGCFKKGFDPRRNYIGTNQFS